MRIWPLVVLATATGCAHRFVECNDTDACRAQEAERERQLARLVAEEPPAERLDVESVSPIVLADRGRRLVYALTPALVALDLASGAERWRVPADAGARLSRAGRYLVIVRDGSPGGASLTFVDADAPASPKTCALALGAPEVAATIALHAFDRAGRPHVFWSSSWSYRGGTPPGGEAEERAAEAEACGVVAVDPVGCGTSAESLSDFVWDPPEGRREKPGDRRFCSYLSVLRDLPAAAASAPRAASAGAGQIALRIASTREPSTERSRCEEVTHLALEARSGAALVWSHPLEDERRQTCGPP